MSDDELTNLPIEHRPHHSSVKEEVIYHDNGLELYILPSEDLLKVVAVINGVEIYANETDVVDRNSARDMKIGFYAWASNPEHRPPGVEHWPPTPLQRGRSL